MLGILNNFLSSLLGFIIQLFFWLLGIIASLIIYPIQALLVTAFPELGEFLSTALTYLTNNVFPMISFVKDVILGITCLPSSLWNALIGILVFRVACVPAVRFIKVVINLCRVRAGNIDLK